MTELELKFCEEYERQGRVLLLLELLKDEMTPIGAMTYHRIKKWLKVNQDKYLELMGSK